MMPDLPPQHPIGAAADGEQPHKPADDREEVYYAGSPMMRGEVGRVLFFFFLGAFFIAIPILFKMYHKDHEWPRGVVTLIFVVLGLIMWSIPWIMTKSLRYRISNYRIDYERGWLSKSIDTLELWHVE